jgi:type IV secretory pathway VirB10-like protein
MHPHLYNLLRNRSCFAPEDGGAGGGAGNPPPPPPKPQDPPEPETFSKDYVRELRAENKGWRLKAQEEAAARKTAEDAAKAAQADADGKITAAQKAANDRIVRAELKAEAIKAGMVDLDGLKLADLSKVTLEEDGTVKGAEELMKALKEAKPWLFGTPGTSGTGTPPPPRDPASKNAKDMTEAEYQAEMKRLTGRKK